MTLDESAEVLVGGGPAGLSAALALGRQRRGVLVCDSDAPANAPSDAVHGALGFDGVAARELRSRGRDECARYPSVSFRNAEAVAVERGDEGRLQVDPTGQTGIPGLYAAGDLCTFAQVTLAISTGAVAGSAASMVLAYEELAKGAERR